MQLGELLVFVCLCLPNVSLGLGFSPVRALCLRLLAPCRCSLDLFDPPRLLQGGESICKSCAPSCRFFRSVVGICKMGRVELKRWLAYYPKDLGDYLLTNLFGELWAVLYSFLSQPGESSRHHFCSRTNMSFISRWLSLCSGCISKTVEYSFCVDVLTSKPYTGA